MSKKHPTKFLRNTTLLTVIPKEYFKTIKNSPKNLKNSSTYHKNTTTPKNSFKNARVLKKNRPAAIFYAKCSHAAPKTSSNRRDKQVARQLLLYSR